MNWLEIDPEEERVFQRLLKMREHVDKVVDLGEYSEVPPEIADRVHTLSGDLEDTLRLMRPYDAS